MMNRDRLVSFIGNFGQKMADIYYEYETKKYYVHYKEILKEGFSDMGSIQYFDTEQEAEYSAQHYAFGEKYGTI